MSAPLLSFKGTWNAVTNQPHLADGVGTAGDCYIILAQTAATHYNVYDNDLGSGVKSWIALHYIYYTGTVWELYERSSSAASSGVTSVNGQTGVVLLDTDDIPEGSNLYFTDTRARAAFSPGTGIALSSGGTITNTAPDQVVVLNQGPGVTITGTYPVFSISSSGGTSVIPAALTTSGDTNITLQASGTTASALLEAVKLTVGWQGTLADSRISSAAVWNAKQPQLNGTGFVKASGTTITYDNSTYLTSGVTSVNGTGGLYSSGTTDISIALTDLGNAGTYGDNTHVPVITTDQKGRVTNISTTPIPLTSGVTSVSGASGEIFASGTTAVTVGLPDKGTAGVYGGAAEIPIITTDGKGRITNITTSSVYSSGVTSVVGASGEIFTSGTSVIHAGLVDVGIAGTYGDSTRVPIITTDSKGRVTAISSANVYSSGVTTVQGTAGLYSSGSPAISIGIADIGVAGTYGSGTQVPVITTNSRGQVTNVSQVSTSGVTTARIINTTSPLQGGGDLSSDRTLSILQASSGATGALLAADWISFNSKMKADFTNASANLPVSLLNSGTGAASNTFWRGDGVWAQTSGGTGGITSVTGVAGLYSSGTPAVSIGLADVGVAGTYGNGYSIPVITTDIKGRITAVSTVSTSGVTSSRSIATTSPLQGGGDLSADRTLSILSSSSGATGALSSTDWNTFNLKVPANRVLTINGSSQDLSADRSWTVSASPAGNNLQVQYNSSGTTGGATNVLIDTDSNLVLASTSGVTAIGISPAGLKLWGDSRAGLDQLHLTPKVGIDYWLQQSLGQKVISQYSFGSSVSGTGNYASSSAAGTTAEVVKTYDATNLLPNYSYRRITSNATANVSAEFFVNVTGRGPTMGNNVYGGGFKFMATFGFPTYLSTERIFIGVTSVAAQNATTTDPSAWLNMLGVAKDAGDTTLQFMTNAGSGTATKVNTGLTPNANDVFRMTLYVPPNSASAYILLEQFTKSSVTAANTTFTGAKLMGGLIVYTHLMVNTGAVASAIQLAIMNQQLEEF